MSNSSPKASGDAPASSFSSSYPYRYKLYLSFHGNGTHDGFVGDLRTAWTSEQSARSWTMRSSRRARTVGNALFIDLNTRLTVFLSDQLGIQNVEFYTFLLRCQWPEIEFNPFQLFFLYPQIMLRSSIFSSLRKCKESIFLNFPVNWYRDHPKNKEGL